MREMGNQRKDGVPVVRKRKGEGRKPREGVWGHGERAPEDTDE